MKKIAFVMDSMDVGGIEKALIELLKAFDYKKYEVTIWLKDNKGSMTTLLDPRTNINYWGNVYSKDALQKQIKDFRIKETIRGIFFRFMCRFYKSSYDLNALYAMRSLPRITEKEYDCVIAYKAISATSVANTLYRFNSAKRVLWVHGWVPRDSNDFRYCDKVFNREYRKFDKVFCVSKMVSEYFTHDFPSTKNISSVFYNLIDADEIGEKALGNAEMKTDHTCLMTVGRLSQVKGQAMIPLTTRLLLDAGYDVYWYLVGDGDLRETVESEIQKYDVAEHVILLGTQMNPYPYIKNCDIYVQPSFSEGYCTTTMEAKILHKPIVTTDAPGMREQFVSGENGLIVDAMTPEALFEGIRTLLDHPELQAKFVENLSHEVCDNSGELQKLYDFIES